MDRFTIRSAWLDDLPALMDVIRLATDELQRAFLTPPQVEASHAIMGLDTQLVSDGKYFVVEHGRKIAGCGGWSRRSTLYGGDHSIDLRDASLLVPGCDAARIRAMYTHPAFTRRGVGRMIVDTCERAAAEEGFSLIELMATLSGEPLYRHCGYTVVERTSATIGAVVVPLARMNKALDREQRP